MTAFLVIGVLGLVILLSSFVLDDAFEGLFEAIDIDPGSGLFSTPVIGAFLAAFGFGAALTLSSTRMGGAAAAAGGVGAGIAIGAAAWWITKAVMRMPTDATVRTGDLVGKTGHVISDIRAGGYGQIAVAHAGHPMHLNARADVAVRRGERVVIVAVTSASSVVVEREDEFWGHSGSIEQGEKGS